MFCDDNFWLELLALKVIYFNIHVSVLNILLLFSAIFSLYILENYSWNAAYVGFDVAVYVVILHALTSYVGQFTIFLFLSQKCTHKKLTSLYIYIFFNV